MVGNDGAITIRALSFPADSRLRDFATVCSRCYRITAITSRSFTLPEERNNLPIVSPRQVRERNFFSEAIDEISGRDQSSVRRIAANRVQRQQRVCGIETQTRSPFLSFPSLHRSPGRRNAKRWPWNGRNFAVSKRVMIVACTSACPRAHVACKPLDSRESNLPRYE